MGESGSGIAGERGLLASMDLMVNILLVLVVVVAAFHFLAGQWMKSAESLPAGKEIRLAYALDAAVKTRAEEGSGGLAVHDFEKRRVRVSSVKEVVPAELAERFGVTALRLGGAGGDAEGCLRLTRGVTLGNGKFGLLEGVACE